MDKITTKNGRPCNQLMAIGIDDVHSTQIEERNIKTKLCGQMKTEDRRIEPNQVNVFRARVWCVVGRIERIHDSCVTGGDRRSNRLFNYIVLVRESGLVRYHCCLSDAFFRLFYNLMKERAAAATHTYANGTQRNELFIELIDFLHDSIFFSLAAQRSTLIVNPFCGAHCAVYSPLHHSSCVHSFRSWNLFREFFSWLSVRASISTPSLDQQRSRTRESCNDFCFCYSLRYYSRRSDAVRITTRHTFTHSQHEGSGDGLSLSLCVRFLWMRAIWHRMWKIASMTFQCVINWLNFHRPATPTPSPRWFRCIEINLALNRVRLASYCGAGHALIYYRRHASCVD